MWIFLKELIIDYGKCYYSLDLVMVIQFKVL